MNCNAPLKLKSGDPIVKCDYCGYIFNRPVARRETIPSWSRASGQIALVAVFTAMCLGTDYAMIGIPNVKIMDSLVFIAAFLFGLRVGAGVAVFTWAIYGNVNPYGLASPILLAFLMGGETFYALGGFLLSGALRAGKSNNILPSLALFPIAGFLTTFAYDVLTNFASYLFLSKSLLDALVIGMVTGAPFALFHEASNIVFFLLAIPPTILASRRLGRLN